MNVTYIVRFRGVPSKSAASLDKMVRDDIAPYPERMSMDSATVEKQKEKKNGKSR